MLEAVYLRPLRNAELELSSGKNSRLSQILLSHPLFKKDDTNKHTLEENFTVLKDTVEKYFNDEQESI
jgi:putative ATP-dependent endonuclease of OLD family